ncbi:MAG: glycosyltransferase family 1 protein [Saprospiraceae bacterium]|nr:glycosyltransferase family 1 protein [Saprospiraceae bacterium]
MSSTKPIYGKELSEIVQDSFLNLNVIDRSNFPAVNMRFFEIIAARGLELCSAGPEIQGTFIDKAHLLYFTSQENLADTVQYAFNNKDKMEEIKKVSQQMLCEKHLYKHRVETLISLISNLK